MQSFRSELANSLATVGRFCEANNEFEAALSGVDSNRDFLVVGSGCSFGVAALIAQQLEARYDRTAKAVTPLSLINSDRTHSAVVFVSSRGTHPHTIAAARSVSSDVPLILLTNEDMSPLANTLRERLKPGIVLSPRHSPSVGGYIPIESCLSILGYVGFEELQQASVAFSRSQQNVSDQVQKLVANASKCDTATILHAGLEGPAAWDLETRLLESGLCFPNVADVWNFAHGRFNGAVRKKTLVVAFATGTTKTIVESTGQIIASNLPFVLLSTEAVATVGSLCCYLLGLEFVACLAEAKGVDPAAPTPPVWGQTLYDTAGH